MSLVLILFLTCALCYFIRAKWQIYAVGRRIPGPWALPLVGNVQMLDKLKPESLFQSIADLRSKFGETYRLWLGPELWVFLHNPEETREALNDPTLTRPATFQQLSVLIGNGLLISHGKHWETHRRALSPAFHPHILSGFTPAIARYGDELVRKLRATAGMPIEVRECLFACTLDAIIETSMGKQLNSLTDPHNRYTHAFHKTSELLFKRMINPLLGLDFIFRRTKMCRELYASLAVINELMISVIDARVEALQLQAEFGLDLSPATSENGIRKQRRTLLDTLLTAEIDGQKLTRAEICDEVNTFVFAGVDTTTAAMCFVLYSLGKYPAEQQKLIAEIEEYSLRYADLTVDALNRLEYLDLFIKEVLRYYTVVPLTGRQTTTDTVIGGRRYCADITLWINLYGLAHDEKYFESPELFRPMRFVNTQNERLPAYVYIPFSGGPHICIGRKYALLIMKILTVQILRNFEVQLSNPNEVLVLQAQMVLKSLQGFNLIFTPRTMEG
ncbi:probable cytochrome P450 311a1 isoform X1 [Anastrepha ludens]|uniref:probable cytochrome P450 311a1 isoform X1 n=1 Tax=Anastrepha ludens TaxID=28586 RepID=UPI0023AFE8D7|nr:probable cytochrome P450 311a1 isoform X1 [Anastrepha ludens]